MTAEILQTISTACFIAAGVLFIIALFLFLYLRIPRVIGDLSGRTARRNIARLRAENEKGGAKAFRPSQVNLERGPLTETRKGLAVTTDGDETQTMETPRPAAGSGDETVPMYGDETVSPDDGADETAELPFNEKALRQRNAAEAARERQGGEPTPFGPITQTFTPAARPEAAPRPAITPAAEETEMLGETEPLDEAEGAGGTELLSTPKKTARYPVTLLEEVMLIHTDEVIA